MVPLAWALLGIAQATLCPATSEMRTRGKSIFDFDLRTLDGEPLKLKKDTQVLLVNVATY
jgi:hypothetical protein